MVKHMFIFFYICVRACFISLCIAVKNDKKKTKLKYLNVLIKLYGFSDQYYNHIHISTDVCQILLFK